MQTKHGLGKHIPLLIMYSVWNVLLTCFFLKRKSYFVPLLITRRRLTQSAWRSGLWSKLIASGISWKVLMWLDIFTSVLNHVLPWMVTSQTILCHIHEWDKERTFHLCYFLYTLMTWTLFSAYKCEPRYGNWRNNRHIPQDIFYFCMRMTL